MTDQTILDILRKNAKTIYDLTTRLERLEKIVIGSSGVKTPEEVNSNLAEDDDFCRDIFTKSSDR